jgi:hypothetical protein
MVKASVGHVSIERPMHVSDTLVNFLVVKPLLIVSFVGTFRGCPPLDVVLQRGDKNAIKIAHFLQKDKSC